MHILLPEFIDEEINNNEVNVEDRDPLFEGSSRSNCKCPAGISITFTKKNETWLQQSWKNN